MLTMNAENLGALCRLFTYPETWPAPDIRHLAIPVRGAPWETMDDSALTALQNSYVRLFINALPQIPCPPYGSFYLEGTLMGASTLRLRRLYGEYGFETEEMPDHIAVELEFMAALWSLPEHDLVKTDQDFLRDQLKQWTPEFFSQIEKSDTMGFYKEVARYAQKIIF